MLIFLPKMNLTKLFLLSVTITLTRAVILHFEFHQSPSWGQKCKMLVSSKVCNSNVTVSAHKQLNWEHWLTFTWPLFMKGKVFKISQWSDLAYRSHRIYSHWDYLDLTNRLWINKIRVKNNVNFSVQIHCRSLNGLDKKGTSVLYDFFYFTNDLSGRL